jgi:F-type H+-transporting ATPase subunit b
VLLVTALLGAEEGGTKLVLPQTNELIWGSIAFLLLFALLWKFVFPKVNVALQARTSKIQGDLEQAERDKEEAAQLLSDYRAQLAAARDESNRILEETRKSAEVMRRDLLAKAESDANRVVARAQEEIVAERDRAVAEVRRETGSIALGLAGKVIGESMDDERHRRLVDRYIEELTPRGEG